MRCNLLIDALCEDKSNGSTLSAAHEDALNDAQESVLFIYASAFYFNTGRTLQHLTNRS